MPSSQPLLVVLAFFVLTELCMQVVPASFQSSQATPGGSSVQSSPSIGKRVRGGRPSDPDTSPADPTELKRLNLESEDENEG